MHIVETCTVEQTKTTHIKCDVCDAMMKVEFGGDTIGILYYKQHPHLMSDRIITQEEYERVFPHRDLCEDCYKKVWNFIKEMPNA